MVHSTEDKKVIKALKQKKDYWLRLENSLLNFLTKPGLRLVLVTYRLRKIEATGSVKRRQGIERENIVSVQELILSQDSQPGAHRSVRDIARETDQSV